ncbi:hypothetical protein [Serinibacter arcticus]|uniref:Uncharacterized protein n=1 Tax=Serinibacter arcticus TaxID=1655435 RepID=A0A4Z1E5V1_9MICO|nr:hypothetical protein [Serinibacter arcticus]TGO06519.1 hypothetical protein SERN_0711 [Serinibacter arcticus]
MNDDLRRFAPRDPDDESASESERALEETVMARLRAADPAADVEPGEDFPAAVGARARADDGSTATATDATPAAPIDLAARRRRPRWYSPAAAAAAAVLIGAGGYAVGAGGVFGNAGSSTADSAESADAASAPAPISLGGASGASGSDAAGAGEMATSAPGLGQQDAAMSARGGADMSMIGWGGGRNSFTGTGLSDAARSAQAYGLDAATPSNPERMAQVAAALGMAGAPEIVDGQWALTDGDAQLNVGLDGSLGLSYYNTANQPWCDGCAEPSPADAPSGDAAIERLKEVLAAIGEDPAQYEYAAPTYEGAVTATAEARRVVDGQGTDLVMMLDLAPAGIASIWGSLADVVDLGTYDVVSEQEGLERLSDPRFGGYLSGMPMPIDGDARVMEEYVPPTQAPAAPQPGVFISWPVNDVEIVSARLGLAQQWQPDGGVLLVPSYEFTAADGGTWSVIAVAESQLDLASE